MNAWPTSSGCNEAKKRSCILGCAKAKDYLAHYVVCDPLWTWIICVTKCSLISELSTPPLQRLCLATPNRRQALFIALAFRVYHAATHNYIKRFLELRQSGQMITLFESLCEFVSAQGKDLDCRLDRLLPRQLNSPD